VTTGVERRDPAVPRGIARTLPLDVLGDEPVARAVAAGVEGDVVPRDERDSPARRRRGR
jgi:hypothetical protein